MIIKNKKSNCTGNLKAFALAALTCLFGGMVSAQVIEIEPQVSLGESEVVRSIEILPRAFGDDTTGYYALTKSPRYGIAHYDRGMNRTREEYLRVNEEGKTREIVNLIHFHDSIYLFFYTEGINTRTLWVKNISKDSLREGDRTLEVYQLPFVRGRKPEFGVEMSRDRSRIMIYSRTIIYQQKRGLLEMMVCGPGLSVNWKNSFRFVFERVPRHLNTFRVDSWGNAYMLDYLYDPPVPNITGRPNKMQVFAVTDNGKKTNTFEIAVPKMYIKSAEIEPAGKDFLVCSGFFSDNDLEGTIKGSFFFRINTAYGVVQNYRDYLIATGDFSSGESYGLFVNHLIHKKSGVTFLVAEQYFPEAHSRYQDIFISLFEPDGQLRWTRIINKRQAFQNSSTHEISRRNRYAPKEYWPDGTPVYNPQSPAAESPLASRPISQWEFETDQQDWDYGSFGILDPLEEDWIGIAYNDDLRNLKRENGKARVFSSGRKSFLRMVRLDEFGYMESRPAYLRDKKKKPVPLPVFYHDTRQGRAVFPAAKGNNTFQMMELRLDTKPKTK